MARFGIVLVLAAQPAFAGSREDCALSDAGCFRRTARHVGRLPGARAARLIAITVTGGGLPRPVVRRMLSSRTGVLGACAVVGHDVHAHVVVAPSGTVLVATADAGSCATDVLRTTRFPASTVVTAIDLTLRW